jgi:hypothetical protein
LALAAVGCGLSSSLGEEGAQLVVLGTPHDVAVGMGRVEAGAETSFGSMILCLDRRGQVTITGVQPRDPSGGIRIDEFGVRPSPFWKHQTSIGAYHGDLEHNHFKAGRKVDVTCNVRTGRGYELAVSVSMSNGPQARMDGVEVTYTSAGETRSVTYPLTIYLCHGEIRGERACGKNP